MARGSLNFFERHVEKIVLALVVGFAIYVFVSFFILTPNQRTYNNQPVAPSELREAILANARQLESRVKSATASSEPVPDFASAIEKRFQAGILQATDKTPALPAALALTAPFGTPLPDFGDQQEQTDVVLVTPLRPDAPVVTTGRALVVARRPEVPPATRDGAGGTRAPADTVEKAWATVAAWYPVDALRQEMINQGYAPFRATVDIAGVEAQRQELLSSGEWGDWVDVTASGAMPQLQIPPAVIDSNGLVQNKTELDDAYRLVQTHKRAIFQPAFFPIEKGDPWRLPALEGLNAATFARTTDLPEHVEPVALAGTGSGQSSGGIADERPDRESEIATERGGRRGREQRTSETVDRRAQRAAQEQKLQSAEQALREHKWEDARRLAQELKQEGRLFSSDFEERADRVIERAAEGLMIERVIAMQEPLEHPAQKGKLAIWFHDDSVQAGKTYRYRIRPTIWNRYVGRAKAVKEPIDATRSVIEGDWSLPSPPITIAPETHFFVSAGSLPARIEVFKWQSGDWKSESFEVGVGEVIGRPQRSIDFTTGAVVIDVREDSAFLMRQNKGKGAFDYRPSRTIVVTYLDPADGRVKQIHYDKYNPEWVRLRSS